MSRVSGYTNALGCRQGFWGPMERSHIGPHHPHL
uniref:Uncharacterized protein n=1 Tax=Anguilla anguilla TaxID=7936 RepID=A0A0E9PS94_ANGAN